MINQGLNRPHHYQMHGCSDSKLYGIWKSIKCRCYNKNRQCYHNYGDRGINICDDWLHDFIAFHDWAVDNGYKEGLTIDRIDNNKGYSPDNCQWVDVATQNRNTRRTINFTYQGETHCLKDWCEIFNLNYGTVKSRVQRGWSIDEALELNERRKTV